MLALLSTYVFVSSKNSGCFLSYLITCSKNFTFLNAISIVFCDTPFSKADFLYDESHVSKFSSALILKEKPTTKIWNIRKKVKIL